MDNYQETRFPDDKIQEFLSQYKGSDLATKKSYCRAAFCMTKNQRTPPWQAWFVLAREIGFKIPMKWEHMYK